MKKQCVSIALLGALSFLPATALAQSASPSPAPSASAVVEDPAVTTRAKGLLHQAQTGQFDRSQLSDKMNAALTDATAKNLASQLGPLGDPTSFTLVRTTMQGTLKVYVYRVAFKDATMAEAIVIDPADGKVAGLWFQ